MAWAKLFEKKEYKIIEQTTVPSGKWISTVWLGLDHQFAKGRPLIFETMVFSSHPKKLEDWGENDMERYSTLEEAKKGHKRMVKKYS